MDFGTPTIHAASVDGVGLIGALRRLFATRRLLLSSRSVAPGLPLSCSLCALALMTRERPAGNERGERDVPACRCGQRSPQRLPLELLSRRNPTSGCERLRINRNAPRRPSPGRPRRRGIVRSLASQRHGPECRPPHRGMGRGVFLSWSPFQSYGSHTEEKSREIRGRLAGAGQDEGPIQRGARRYRGTSEGERSGYADPSPSPLDYG